MIEGLDLGENDAYKNMLVNQSDGGFQKVLLTLSL